MSRLRANQITNENANGAPNFPHGLTVTGVVTATTSATTMSQIVVGSAVTANSTGVDTVGIVTAGTLKDKAGGTFAPNPTTTRGDIIVRGASVNERLAIGSAGQVLKVNSSANGLEYGGAGSYSVEKIQRYVYGSTVAHTSGRTDYIDIAGGNYLTFTPTSTDDFIIFGIEVEVYCSTNNHGTTVYIMRGTSTNISSSDTKIMYNGQHANHGTWYHMFHSRTIIMPCTGLTAGQNYYFEAAGASHSATSNQVNFNHNNTNHTSDGRHVCYGVHYKKN